MSRFQKIFLASTFVLVGFGVAKFLGQPVLPTQLLSPRTALPALPAVVQAAPASSGGPQATGHVRLLPDSSMTHVGAPAMSAGAAAAQSPGLGNTLSPVLAASDNAEPRTFDFAPISSAPISGADSPRARLRNEAPRAVGVDPQSPAAIHRLPTDNVAVTDPYKVADTKGAPAAWSPPQLLNAGYSASFPAPPTALPASYSAPMNNLPESQFAPPPWPAPEEAAETRVHIVVDGDSLERIASRYLSDPQRSREIYELNRQVLSAPDMLPIGVELKIPDRVASASSNRTGFQPNTTIPKPTTEAGRDNITPARPVSTPQGIIPRAQLAPPVMVQ